MAYQLRHSMAVLGLCTTLTFAGTASAEPNDGVEGLNEEQQSFAGRFLQFQDDMDEKLFGRAGLVVFIRGVLLYYFLVSVSSWERVHAGIFFMRGRGGRQCIFHAPDNRRCLSPL